MCQRAWAHRSVRSEAGAKSDEISCARDVAEPMPVLNGRDWVVDFNQTICIPGKEFPGILQSKKLQMEDEWRVKFKIKLATCLARLTNEERAAGLIDPWVGKQKDI